MTKKQIHSAKQRILPRPGAKVKAQIVAADIPLGRLAASARISQPALSNYLNGARRDRHTQLKIWDAFRCLSGRGEITLEDFWGEMLSERIAS